MQQKAILIGNSDGIGLAMTKKLLSAGWNVNVAGISRSKSPVKCTSYKHRIADVTQNNYSGLAVKKQLIIWKFALGENQFVIQLRK